MQKSDPEIDHQNSDQDEYVVDNWRDLKTTLKIMLLVVLVIFIYFCGYFKGKWKESERLESYYVVDVAERLNIEPNWTTVKDYVYCDLLTIGTPLEEVIENLILVGPVDIDESISDHSIFVSIEFEDHFTRYNLRDLWLVFDAEHNLKEKYRLNGLSETIEIKCP